MNAWLILPLELRLVLLFVLGAATGGLLNLAIYRLGWRIRAISPWTPGWRHNKHLRWPDLVPISGWLSLRRHGAEHGKWFWLRPLGIELLTGLGFAALYWWEVDQHALLGIGQQIAVKPPHVWPCPGGWQVNLHLTYASHLILIALMTVASVIDIDDRIIPDTITVPGTLAGLLLAALVPWSLLPNEWLGIGPPPGMLVIDFLKLTSPIPWPARLAGAPNVSSLFLGWACYLAWCFAILPRHWRTRHGWKRAVQIFTARIVREPWTRVVIVIGLTGMAGIYVVWRQGDAYWAGLLTSLVGMAASGGLIWTVRVIGSVVLGREAMGFGDVTLMAMVGTFLGWQPAVFIFFVAPLFAVLIGIGSWLLHRDPAIPYGPFLCLGSLAVMVRWADIWDWGNLLFGVGWLVPAVMALCMVTMAILLGGIRLLRRILERAG